jgi:hypothetical protein
MGMENVFCENWKSYRYVINRNVYAGSLQSIKLYWVFAVIYVILGSFSVRIRAIYNKYEPYINNNKRTKTMMVMKMISIRRTIILIVKLQLQTFIN